MGTIATFNLRGELISEESHPVETDRTMDELANILLSKAWGPMVKALEAEEDKDEFFAEN